jgi:hypothetical protein
MRQKAIEYHASESVPKSTVFRTPIFGVTKQRHCWVSEPSLSEGFRNTPRMVASFRAGAAPFYAARSSRLSISMRGDSKSIGFVRSASAPFSRARRLVSESP